MIDATPAAPFANARPTYNRLPAPAMQQAQLRCNGDKPRPRLHRGVHALAALFAVLALAGCAGGPPTPSPEELRRLEQQRLEQEAQLARERWEFEERMRREREAQELARQQAEEAERQRQAQLAVRRAVQEVERSWRSAAVGDNRYVLRLRNGSPVGAQFQLRCYLSSPACS